jgi:glycosyltransferase involved in cell wall biosynthesis
VNQYLFFTRNQLPQPAAHLVQVAHSANAAANLGYDTVLAHYQWPDQVQGPGLVWPYQPQPVSEDLRHFYGLQDRLKIAPLAIPDPFWRETNRWANTSTLINKYYLPIHIRSKVRLVHSRDWNFIEAAVKLKIPAIYEHHHHEEKQFNPAIVNSPYFQVAATVAPAVRDSMIAWGMPEAKAIWLHNGCNQSLGIRRSAAAAAWRAKLCDDRHPQMVVYSGALHRFKGVDLLLEVAALRPAIQFVFAGGAADQVAAYRQAAIDRNLDNLKFLGYLEQEQLASLLQAADLLAHPHGATREAGFTSPLKLFDYFASGTPIVATEIEPLREFRELSAIAAWADPDRADQFAAAIDHGLAQRPRPVDGFDRPEAILQAFSWESRIAKMLDYVRPEWRPKVV